MGGRSGKRTRTSSRGIPDHLTRAAGRGTERIPNLVPGGAARAAACRFLGLTPSASDERVHLAIRRLLKTDDEKLQEYYSRFVDTYEAVTQEVRYVDDRTCARIRRWQEDPVYGEVPYESVHEGGDPEDVDVDLSIFGPDSDPDLEERITEVQQEAGRRTARRLSQIPEYRRHVRRINALLSSDGGYDRLSAYRTADRPRR